MALRLSKAEKEAQQREAEEAEQRRREERQAKMDEERRQADERERARIAKQRADREAKIAAEVAAADQLVARVVGRHRKDRKLVADRREGEQGDTVVFYRIIETTNLPELDDKRVTATHLVALADDGVLVETGSTRFVHPFFGPMGPRW